MLLATVIGKVWAERQLEGLDGRRLVLIRDVTSDTTAVAVDLVDVSPGSTVLVATDEAAQAAVGHVPVDAVVIALVAGMDQSITDLIK